MHDVVAIDERAALQLASMHACAQIDTVDLELNSYIATVPSYIIGMYKSGRPALRGPARRDR